MSNVIQFKPRPEAPKPESKPQRSFRYELLFLRNLAIWLAVGAVLGLIFPAWVVFTGLIVLCYFDGKRQRKE